MSLAAARPVRAEPLLTPVEAARAPGAGPVLPGVSRVQTFALGPTALGDLRGQPAPVVPGFPLGRDGTATLELERFTPFAPHVRIEVVGDDGVHALAPPDRTYFMGAVRGDPKSRVLLIAGSDHVQGYVATAGAVYAFGPNREGTHLGYSLADVDPAAYPPPGDFCANDLDPETVEEPGVLAQALAEAGLVPPPIAPIDSSTMVQADVAVDTDYELRAKFGSDQGTLDYLAALVAAGTAIYERDVNVRLAFSYVRLWSTPSDPWSATSTIGALGEVRSYWLDPLNNMDAIAGSHDLVHFISGKTVQGGVAYLNAVCNESYGFGVSQVYGVFDTSVPSQIWDVVVTTHELGHNLGTPHTHCYSPPLDKCYNGEGGCYSGPEIPSRGEIMSYCHLHPGGLANIDLLFGSTVSAEIRSLVNVSSCLDPVVTGTCGNGVVESGEQCDDGNTTAGDGCSATCRFEVCGNGIIDPGETCDDGNTVSDDGCSATCEREPRCGDGTLDAGEECDDGNTASDDGCSATCGTEPCVVYVPLQTIWSRAVLTVRKSGGGDRLNLKARFGIMVPFASLDPRTNGLRLVLQDATGEKQVDVTLPPGAGWGSAKRRWRYRGNAGGIRKLILRDLTKGGIPEVQLLIVGRGGDYMIDSAALPPTAIAVLGDDAAGQAGACGRHSFGSSCKSRGGGRRIVCR